jgi:hypothetical protein
VLSIGGLVRVNEQDTHVPGIADLPKEAFLLTLAVLESNKEVTDAGLAVFKGCKSLVALGLVKTKVTATGIDDLKKALPACKIKWDGGVIDPTMNLDPDCQAWEKARPMSPTIGIKKNGAELQILAGGATALGF